MGNPVLDRLREERTKQVDYIQTLLARVDEDQRDLVDAETQSLTSIRERITQIDAQIEPLEQFEQARAAHEETRAAVTPTVRHNPAGSRLGVQPRAVVYPTPGHFMVDHIRAQKHYGPNGQEFGPDADAAQRIAAARDAALQTRANEQVLAETPGILPVTIQGQIEDQVDGDRPFLTAIGIKPLAGVPGTKFSRPHVTQHTQVGVQAAELAPLSQRTLKIEGVEFTKSTAGGSLKVSRQDIDWTSPAAWNIILNDLMGEYAEETDAIAADVFQTGVTQAATDIPLADAEKVTAWVKALYEAAVIVATKGSTVRASSRRLPDTIFTSIDMWGTVGAILDAAAISQPGMNPGGADARTFAGSILRFPRIMVPGLDAGKVIVGRKSRFEFYEERIGLLSAVLPTVLGVEIAYGGYTASGFLDATAFANIGVAAQ